MKPELTNDELLDRYVHSVTMGLPPDKRDDIAAEVRSNLQSRADDLAKELGREPTPREMSGILKQHGHPVVVAALYREQPGRGLISPELFPLYKFTLRTLVCLWLTVRVIIAVFQFQGTASAISILLRLGRDIVVAAFIITAAVTLVFAVWEYLESRFRYSQRWKPESLPPVARPVRRSPPRPMFQIVGQSFWLIFWAMALFLPQMWWVFGARGVFGVSDAVYAMRLSMWILAAVGVAQSWLSYTRFASAEWRVLLRVALYAAGISLAIYLLHAGDLLVAGPKWVSTQAKPLATLNQMTGGMLVLACIAAVLCCVQDLRRCVRKSGHQRLGGNDRVAGSAS